MNLSLDGVKAIIFDFDGTLYDFKSLPFRLISTRLQDIFRIAKERTVRRALRGCDMQSSDIFYKEFARQLKTHCFVSEKSALAWYQKKYLPHMIRVLSRFYTARFGAVDLLTSLRSIGIRTAVFSDYSKTAERMAAVGIAESLCDVCCGAEDFGALKPAIRPFLAIAKQLSVTPSQVLVVGDRDDTDGEGALAAGMMFVKIQTYKNKTEPDAISWENFLTAILPLLKQRKNESL